MATILDKTVVEKPVNSAMRPFGYRLLAKGVSLAKSFVEILNKKPCGQIILDTETSTHSEQRDPAGKTETKYQRKETRIFIKFEF